MNPSYDNSFGSLSSGGTSGDTSGGVFGGTANRQDIMLSSGPEKKQSGSKKWIVILVAVLVIVGVGVGVGLWMMNRQQSGGSDQAVVGDVKVAFNEYANYVLKGENSGNDFDENIISEMQPYFEKLSKSQINEYVNVANQKFEGFAKIYVAKLGEYNVYDLADYYQTYVMIANLSDNEIIAGGISGSGEYSMRYLSARKGLAEIVRQVEDNAANKGCASVEACYEMTENENNTMAEYLAEIMSIETRIKINAYEIFMNVYNEIYVEDA